MQEIVGDLFAHNEQGPEAICVTTNGFVNSQGALTMGRGCAREAKVRWPGIQMTAGELVRDQGNNVFLLTEVDEEGIFLPARLGWPKLLVPYHVLTFPTKHHWREPSDIKLIDKSCQQLRRHVDEAGFNSVVLPRPGCGLGQLTWDEVRPICQAYLDDRFFVITFPPKENIR